MLLPRPVIVSIVLHGSFALLMVFGLPFLGRDLPEEMPIVRLEIVQTVPQTNLIEGDKPSTAKEEQTATVSKNCLLYTSPSPCLLYTSPSPRDTA